jgi:hypothetical protein
MRKASRNLLRNLSCGLEAQPKCEFLESWCPAPRFEWLRVEFGPITPVMAMVQAARLILQFGEHLEPSAQRYFGA